MCPGGEWTYTCNAETKGDVSGSSLEYLHVLRLGLQPRCKLAAHSAKPHCFQARDLLWFALPPPAPLTACPRRMLGSHLTGRRHVSTSNHLALLPTPPLQRWYSCSVDAHCQVSGVKLLCT